MMDLTKLSKPFSAAWRARGYLVAALVFWIAQNVLPLPFQNVGQKSWWQDLVDKAVGSFDKISYFLLLAGLIYAVVSDLIDYIWSNNLQPEMNKCFKEVVIAYENSLKGFSSGLAKVSFEAVKVWIESKNSTRDQSAELTKAALVEHYGAHNKQEDSLINFLLEDVLDKWGGQASFTWENFNSRVTLRSSLLAQHFEWEENRTYTLVCQNLTGKVPLRLEGSTRVDESQLSDAIDGMDFHVKFGDKEVINFKSWWASQKKKKQNGKFKVETDIASLEYDGIWLNYSFFIMCEVDRLMTDVTIFEKSYVSDQDRCYTLAVRHPTRGVHASLTLELPGWIVKQPFASASLYQSERRAVRIAQNHNRTCAVNMPGWTLPGVGIVIEWTPAKLDGVGGQN